VSGGEHFQRPRRYGTDQYVGKYEVELACRGKAPDTWIRLSFPFLHADRSPPDRCPVRHKDFNVPLLNSEQMYQALRSVGVETELVIYPVSITPSTSRATGGPAGTLSGVVRQAPEVGARMPRPYIIQPVPAAGWAGKLRPTLASGFPPLDPHYIRR